MLNTPPERDFLTQPDRSAEKMTLSFSNGLLGKILRELKKSHPSQRCVIETQYSNPAKILDSSADIATIRFLSSGKPILAQYLAVVNNTGEIVNVGLNEPVVLNAATTFGTGIRIAGGATFQIPVELEMIQLRLISAAAGKGIVINNGPAGVPVNGDIQVYAWTIPNSDKDESE